MEGVPYIARYNTEQNRQNTIPPETLEKKIITRRESSRCADISGM
jgi:hypothetical protein